MLLKATLALSLVSTALSATTTSRNIHKGFGDLDTLVVFGDSYTDEGRLGYMIGHNGALPPANFMPDEATKNSTSDGGRIWARIIADETGFKLYNYAVSGAVCSNDLTPRSLGAIHGNFPDIKGYEVPQFEKEHKMTRYSGAGNLNPDKTIFAIWIGTNDLGNQALLTDEHLPGVSLPDVTDCVVDQVRALYNYGARKFIVMNVVPLEKSPQYTENGPNHYFPGRDTYLGGNITAINQKIGLLVKSANDIWKYQLPALADELRGAKVAMFRAYDLVNDIYAHPKNYLDAPYNTNGYISHCYTVETCSSFQNTNLPNPGSYIWYDELHPSVRTDTIVAHEMEKAFRKESSFATYYF